MSDRTMTSPSGSMRTAHVGLRLEVAADRGRRRHSRSASRPRAGWPASSDDRSQPKRSAPSRRHSARRRPLSGRFFSGSMSVSLREPQLDRIHAELFGQLVHRGSRTPSGPAVRPGRAPARPARRRVRRAPAAGQAVGRRVERAGRPATHPRSSRSSVRGLHIGVVAERGELAIGVGRKPDPAERCRPMADQREICRRVITSLTGRSRTRSSPSRRAPPRHGARSSSRSRRRYRRRRR